MKRLIILLAASLLTATQLHAAARPRLIVQIVVGSMRAEELDRYAANFCNDGFLRLRRGGTEYLDSRYEYQQTTTPVSLATLTTGAMPSTHGVIGTRWQNYTENRTVRLLDGRQGCGPYNLIAPTLAQTMEQQLEGSRQVSIAAEATSAVVMAGKGGEAFWLDSLSCGWSSSTYYEPILPAWIERSNREGFNRSYLDATWRTLLSPDDYVNTRSFDIELSGAQRGKERIRRADQGPELRTDLDRMLYSPAGNTAVLGFAKQAIAQFRLGADETPDLLNICLDASRRITEAYGPESIEAEDMYYRLDRDLADFLTFLFAQVKDGNVTVVLTSDHGTSPSYDAGSEPLERFNTRQFEVIVNSFLNARYGSGDWLLAYEDQCIYLNHNLVYERGLNLSEVQNEVAIFAMQFRGVSHALSATAMRTSYFGSGYAQRMQNSFYPRRSGDVILNLMPGWIEERDRCRSASGSMYGYDTHVPLLFYGTGAGMMRIKRRVDMTCVAPTLARLLEITEPAASEGGILPEIVDL